MWFGWDYSDPVSDGWADLISAVVLTLFLLWMCALIGYGVVIVCRGESSEDD